MQISGIQQLGIGIPDVHKAWSWYRKAFGMNVPVFEEAAEANLMLPYTGNSPQSRHAILALNMQGGSGFEIWQYVGRVPQASSFEAQIGDLGIFAGKIKTRNIVDAHEHVAKFTSKIGEINNAPDGTKHFFCEDPFGNLFEVAEFDNWFSKGKEKTGGAFGAIVGCSNLDESLKLYKDVLGYDDVIFDKTGIHEDLSFVNGGGQELRRVRLGHSHERKGPFAPLLGSSQIELVQSIERKGRPIFEDRFWGDLGFIHLCFDIRGMDELRTKCKDSGFPFTVDSAHAHKDGFDMGEAAGHFSYIEDPDGTLIEFVETHKVPIAKKLNWYLDLTKRPEQKPLPRWMLKAMGLSRVKD